MFGGMEWEPVKTLGIPRKLGVFVISRETNVLRWFLYVGPSVQFNHSVMSDPLWPHGLQHSRPPCPTPTPGVYSKSCSLSWWCHPIISSSIVPLSSHLLSFPASGSSNESVRIRWPKDWSFSFSISPSNEYSGLISFRIDHPSSAHVGL